MLAVEWPLVRAALRRRAEEPTPAESEAQSPAPPFPVSQAMQHLAMVKSRVPAVRNAVGDRAWTAMVNENCTESKNHARGSVASRAYYKMREIQQSCAIPVPLRSLHLCEAPGGFVQAVNDDLVRGMPWEWVATSIEVPGAPAPAFRVLPMDKGRFFVGDALPGGCDILQDACVDALVAMGPFDLVTGDGATAMDHDALECAHLPLLVGQTIAALRCLRDGGSLVLKFFEGALPETQVWLAFLTTRFGHVSLIKPATSRPTNSERYVVARDYQQGATDAAVDEDLRNLRGWAVADMWQHDLQRILDRMATDQYEALEAVLRTATLR